MQTLLDDTTNERLAGNANLRRRFQALSKPPVELPLSSILWFVISGLSLWLAVAVGRLPGDRLLTLLGAAGLIAFAVISFICGSLSRLHNQNAWKKAPPLPAVDGVSEQVDELIASLQRAMKQPSPPISQPTQVSQLTAAPGLPTKNDSQKQPEQTARLSPSISLERYVKDDQAIAEVLEQSIGSTERLIS